MVRVEQPSVRSAATSTAVILLMLAPGRTVSRRVRTCRSLTCPSASSGEPSTRRAVIVPLACCGEGRVRVLREQAASPPRQMVHHACVRWKKVSSDDVIDARGGGGGGLSRGGMVAGGGGLGLIGIIILVVIQLLGGGGGGGGTTFDVPGQISPGADANARPLPPGQDPDAKLKDFSVYVFESTQKMWRGVFDQAGRPYDRAKLYLYSGAVNTACGSASSAVGPFYCPGDQRVYLDLSFQRDMRDQLGAEGDFAWAYVIAHEMGHHVQRVLGTERKVRELQQRNPGDRNALSVRMELQADCYSGVWAHSAIEDLEPGDIEEGMNAANAVGDDRLQQRAGGQIDPDSFTHGSSEQRMRWFKQGYERGDPGSCDVFSAEQI